MNIEICNCKNIDHATIGISENMLNIKYAMNGTGKSTIAKAIKLFIEKTADVSELVPFKYKDKTILEEQKPLVTGCDTIKSIALFNEEYVSQFTFQPDEVLANSFDIFIKTPDYEKRMIQIEELVKEIRKSFKDSEEIAQTINDFTQFIDSFGKSKTGYSAAGALAKGLGNGNKIENIPEGLDSYTEYLRSDKKIPWLSWQIKGNDYLGISKNCPFCTSEVEEKKATIEKVKKEYDVKSIEHLNNVLIAINKIEKYFSPEVRARVRELSIRSSALLKEEFAYLVQIKEQIIILREKLADLKEISFFSFKDVDKVIDFLNSLRINLDFIQLLKSEETEKLVTFINDTLNKVVDKASILQGEINKQKASIEKTVKEYSNEIKAPQQNLWVVFSSGRAPSV